MDKDFTETDSGCIINAGGSYLIGPDGKPVLQERTKEAPPARTDESVAGEAEAGYKDTGKRRKQEV